MTEQEHLGVARHFNELGRQLYGNGGDDAVAAGEMWWGAVNRIINALALQHRLDDGGRLPRRGVVTHHLLSNHITGHRARMSFRDGLHAAGRLHGHFYYSHLEPCELADRDASARAFIADLFDLYDAGVSRT